MFVRLAIDEVLAALRELCCDAVVESVRGLAPDPKTIDETISASFATAEPTFFVVEQQRQLIGFMMASIGSYPFAAGIFTTQQVMYVRPDKRGTRAAALLVRHLIAWSTRLGAKEITGGNTNGLYTEQTARLLEKHGFERVGVFLRRPGER